MRLADRLKRAAESLSEHPYRGRPVGGLRELVAIPPYIIRYQVGVDTVEIVRIKHAAQAND